jgi:hypothetical protein
MVLSIEESVRLGTWGLRDGEKTIKQFGIFLGRLIEDGLFI